ncbi:uncharacterized protein Fot_21569 [Forsythia ovata]|uniref:Uncharacterized protein n=1 Tax=Forsythia ovata TaxID=205694 RepID=A0ABD1UW93_9LAMI
MATLQELVDATKILGQSVGEVVDESTATGFLGLGLGENSVEIAVETEKTLETTLGGKGKLQSNLNVEVNGAENVNLISSVDNSFLVREEECNQNGINLIVDVIGSLDGVDGSNNFFQTNGDEDSFAENE